MGRIFFLGLALLLVGCVSQSSLDRVQISAMDRQGAVFIVDHQPKDNRSIDSTIVEALQSHGIEAVKRNQATGVGDFVVSYIDRWHWDMRTYLIDLRIDVRRSESDQLVGSARSYQTSLAAMGNSYRDIVRTVVDVLLLGLPEKKERGSGRKRK